MIIIIIIDDDHDDCNKDGNDDDCNLDCDDNDDDDDDDDNDCNQDGDDNDDQIFKNGGAGRKWTIKTKTTAILMVMVDDVREAKARLAIMTIKSLCS
ncbi:hypothetical protein PoB_000783600 [Plakobranchus ocellatus]|uniref:Uncharacterized protein n=1 Tax=Plakobranchus ocellatus TaxID=259542 RepID=A0AAV3YDS1_9GAST|nr:hypothetical protein PoB_000783600 [Plakobranchus ocellatus]